MTPVRTLISIATAIAIASACTDRNPTAPDPDPLVTVALTGVITDSLIGQPRVQRHLVVVDQYEFGLFVNLFPAESWNGGRPSSGITSSLNIWGEGPRPRQGTLPLTASLAGTPGSRTHAILSREFPTAQYHAVSGELRITLSTPDWIAGTFEFHAVPGVLFPDGPRLRPDLPAVDVKGSFTARCDDPMVCR
jgi:hypothetical protein